MKKKLMTTMLAITMIILSSIVVYAVEVDRTTGTVGSYSCNGTLWTITSKSMGATTYVSTSSSNVSSNRTKVKVRSGGYDPVEEEDGPYASNEVDVTATIGGNIGSATGTHYLTLKTGDSWSGDTYY